jgi:uncharacterized Zn finger protein
LKEVFSAWQKLTWDDLEQWAGSRSVDRGKAYQQQGRVRELSAAEDGSIIATVIGRERYLALVTLDTQKQRRVKRLASVCSCPVAVDCKHAVATVIELLEQLDSGASIAELEPSDFRLKLLAGETEGVDDRIADVLAKESSIGSSGVNDTQIRDFLQSQTQAQLVDRLMFFCVSDQQVRTAIVDEIRVNSGRSDELAQAVYQEMRAVTSEEALSDGWDESDLPNYNRLTKRLKMLVDFGCANDVVKLGEELVRRASDQISYGGDDRDIYQEVTGCLEVVAEAIAASTLPDHERLLLAIRMTREDQYGLCDAIESLLLQDWPDEAWSTVADGLWVELGQSPSAEKSRSGFSARYRRTQLSNWLIRALDSAGRTEEALEICVAEASQDGEYVRAIDRLLAEKQLDAAESLALEGLAKVDPAYRGTLFEIQDRIAEIAKARKDWPAVAAFAAQRFFETPSVDNYQKLVRAAKKAKCENQIVKAAMSFLETGQRPDRGSDGSLKSQATKAWPLPLPPPPQPAKGAGYPRSRSMDGPYYEVLIELAIAQRRPDEVLRWYDLRRAAQSPSLRGVQAVGVGRGDVTIAQAVEQSHPERAIEIYLQLAHAIAAQTNVKTYPEVGTYLKHAKPLLATAKSDRTWEGILTEFRTQYARKPRLMDVIDRLGKRVTGARVSKSRHR